MLVQKTAQFCIGQIVQHRLLHFRGVVVDIDFYFLSCIHQDIQTSNADRGKSALWYHVLVDNSEFQIYVPEAELIRSKTTTAINHPALEYYFWRLKNGVYQPKRMKN